MSIYRTVQTGRMNPEIREEWRAELESGKYNQGQSRLHHIDNTGHETLCCLGVLCKIAVKHGIIPEPTQKPATNDYGIEYEYGEEADLSTAILPGVVAAWAGLTSTNGTYDRDNSLSTDNDQGADFHQISAIIGERF